MSESTKLCGLHLPGNTQCPYAALYVVRWKHHSLENCGPTGAINTYRYICEFHLAPAIHDAVMHSRVGEWPGITLAALGNPL